MSPNRTFYDVLEVPLFAAPDTVKAAYRKLARKYHPDINPGNPDAERLFKEIGEAYAVLSDPQKRLAYDQSLSVLKSVRSSGAPSAKPDTKGSRSAEAKATAKPGPARSPGGSKAPPRSKAAGKTAKPAQAPFVDIQGTKFKEMFDALFRKEERDAAGSPSSSGKTPDKPPGGKGTKGQPPVRGEDLTVETVISRAEADSGVVKTVNVQHTEPCKRCSGTGKVNSVPCPVCHGDKQMITLKKIEVRIPAGVKSGSKVRVAKEGGRGLYGGEAGDLFLQIKVEEDHGLKIDGLNVLTELALSIPEAVLGTELEVPTLKGRVKMVIPPKTADGTTLRLKGQGVTAGNSTGDQLVTVRLVMPGGLSARERELYQELLKLQKPPR